MFPSFQRSVHFQSQLILLCSDSNSQGSNSQNPGANNSGISTPLVEEPHLPASMTVQSLLNTGEPDSSGGI
jgi:hypothetical protein